MLDYLMDNKVFQLIFGLFASSVGACILCSAREIIHLYKTRKVRKFWKSFNNDPMSIIFSEYEVPQNDNVNRIATVATSGYLVSRGMALSLATILNYSKNGPLRGCSIRLIGSCSNGEVEDGNILIIGGPASNDRAMYFLKLVSERYNLPYSMYTSEDSKLIKIITDSGDEFVPSYIDGGVEDFAIVTKATYIDQPFSKSVIMIFGCLMWGSQAATEVVTNEKFIDIVNDYTDGADDVSFIVKASTTDGGVLHKEVLKEYITVLEKK